MSHVGISIMEKELTVDTNPVRNEEESIADVKEETIGTGLFLDAEKEIVDTRTFWKGKKDIFNRGFSTVS